MTQREQELLRLIEADPMISQQELADSLGITRSSVAVHISNLVKKGYIAGKGYVLRSGVYAAVVGGVNMDIGGRAHAPLVASDSNPGTVSMSVGGVSRNIAHNLALLGVDVRMLTALGDDLYGQKILCACTEQGIDMSHAQKLPGESTSTYLYIAAPDGEMSIAISDMGICDRINSEYLAANLSTLQNARVVVADTNIPEEALIFLVKNCKCPLFVDPVSTVKAVKLRPILSNIHTLKPNRLEAELLSGIPIHSKEDVANAAKVLLDMGVQRIFISMGADGVYAAEGEQGLWLPNLPGRLINTTGCGDAFMGALVWAYLEGLDLKQSALAGLAAGSIAMESNQTINPNMSKENLKIRMNY